LDWIKVMCNILDHRKIKMIRKGPEGNTLVLLWLLMLIEAGKCERGGYLMISDSLPYTAETLGMVTDIPLPTVQLGLATFAGLEMIDQRDGVICLKNWSKYQSEDKLKARREKDRERQQRHRQREREKILLLQAPENPSRDSHPPVSRDVTPENRTDKSRGEETTTDKVRLLLSGTPLSGITDHELQALSARYGSDQLIKAADIAAETYRRERAEIWNPGGYLNALCGTLVVPSWYLPPEERAARARASEERRIAAIRREEERKAFEEKMATAKQELWSSLTAAERDGFCTAARASVKGGLQPPAVAVAAIAKSLAWESRSRMHTIGFPACPGSTDTTSRNQEVAESE
jgi:predicted phage replisome organizer